MENTKRKSPDRKSTNSTLTTFVGPTTDKLYISATPLDHIKKVDFANRVTIPKDFLREMCIEINDELEFSLNEDKSAIIIKKHNIDDNVLEHLTALKYRATQEKSKRKKNKLLKLCEELEETLRT